MQGFNMGRYIPPDALDSGLTNANVASGKGHALGSRARKLGQGILTVRFEMPFAVWCTSCPQPTLIAQGVRFNAEKKKIGNYHSTPILSFRIKHNACGGWLDIRTDPKNAEYVVHEGGKRRDYGEDQVDKSTGSLGEILTEEEKERRRNDAFAAFEGKMEDKQRGTVEGQRVEELLEDRAKHWRDPYALNQRLRKTFRAERKVRHRKEQEKEGVRDRLGLSLDLLDETEADRRAAALVAYGTVSAQNDLEHISQRLSSKPLFSSKPLSNIQTQSNASLKQRAESSKIGMQPKAKLQETLKENTRLAVDPFIKTDPSVTDNERRVSETRSSRRQRRFPSDVEANLPLANGRSSGTTALSRPLVAYDSD